MLPTGDFNRRNALFHRLVGPDQGDGFFCVLRGRLCAILLLASQVSRRHSPMSPNILPLHVSDFPLPIRTPLKLDQGPLWSYAIRSTISRYSRLGLSHHFFFFGGEGSVMVQPTLGTTAEGRCMCFNVCVTNCHEFSNFKYTLVIS